MCISGQIPLKLKFRCYNPVSMHLKTSSEFFKNSNQEIQDRCNEHAQLCEHYHPDECPKSHFGGAIFLTIVLTGTVSDGFDGFWRISAKYTRQRSTEHSNYGSIRSKTRLTLQKALATVVITYFTRQFIARRRLTEFPSLELDEDEDTEYIDN